MLQPLLRPVAVAANDRLRGASPLVLPAPPVLDLDFVGRPSLQYPGLPPLAFSRADTVPCATYRDSAGVRRIAAANAPRFDHDVNGNRLGLLKEASRTNFLLNSTAPANQTTGSLGTGTHVLWVEGTGSATVGGNTATVTGAGTATEGSPVTFDVTVAGTVDVTVTGALTAFQLENATGNSTSYASSLIVTTGATLTREADIISIPLGSGFNHAEGAFMVELSHLAPSPNSGISGEFLAQIGAGSNANYHALLNPLVPTGQSNVSSTIQGQVTTAGGLQGGAVKRLIYGYRANDFMAANAGMLGTQDTSGSVPVSGLTTLYVGSHFIGAHTCARFRRIAYWPRRLVDNVLQALTR